MHGHGLPRFIPVVPNLAEPVPPIEPWHVQFSDVVMYAVPYALHHVCVVRLVAVGYCQFLVATNRDARLIINGERMLLPFGLFQVPDFALALFGAEPPVIDFYIINNVAHALTLVTTASHRPVSEILVGSASFWVKNDTATGPTPSAIQ